MERDVKIDWTKDRVLQLIEYWRKCKCLYDPNHTFYTIRSSRQDALESITRQMQISTPQITVNDVKTKINYLRSQYCREMHKYQEVCHKTGTESDDCCNTGPYWFDNMSFVKNFVKVRSNAAKRGKIGNSFHLSNISAEASFDEMPVPIKRSKSVEISPSSTDQTEETSMYWYKPDPDILEIFQKQIATVTSSQPSTSSQAKTNLEAATILQPIPNLYPTTSNNATSSEYDQTFMGFIKVNLALVTDTSLKDELLDKITMLLLEYKGKQRQINSQKK